MSQLDSPRGTAELLAALTAPSPALCVRSGYGNRSTTPAAFWKRLKPLLPLAGITRTADLSWFSPVGYPVAQSCRPFLLTHCDFGPNTGSQGKGEGLRARISAAMEAVEGFGAEPRNAEFIRASYDQLKEAYVILDPARYQLSYMAESPVKPDEPLLWTRALSLEHRIEVLVPAVTVHHQLLPNAYRTRGLFNQGTTGLAAGATYEEAIIQGLYEVIERHYWGHIERGAGITEALFENEIGFIDLRRLSRVMPEAQLQFYAHRLERLPKGMNFPFVSCLVVTDDQHYRGLGLHANADTAIQRALGEALQARVTVASGAREDIHKKDRAPNPAIRLPAMRSLHYRRFTRRTLRRSFKSIRSELAFLTEWCHRAGFKNILVANLTRVGLEIPTVRVVVPGMMGHLVEASGDGWTEERIQAKRYSFPKGPTGRKRK
jgi:ribosomal protein S12 methylthiotransferase accessory factor